MLSLQRTEALSLAEKIFEEVNLRCPRCRHFQDPNPDGCANMACASCKTVYCWVCFLEFGGDSLREVDGKGGYTNREVQSESKTNINSNTNSNNFYYAYKSKVDWDKAHQACYKHLRESHLKNYFVKNDACCVRIGHNFRRERQIGELLTKEIEIKAETLKDKYELSECQLKRLGDSNKSTSILCTNADLIWLWSGQIREEFATKLR